MKRISLQFQLKNLQLSKPQTVENPRITNVRAQTHWHIACTMLIKVKGLHRKREKKRVSHKTKGLSDQRIRKCIQLPAHLWHAIVYALFFMRCNKCDMPLQHATVHLKLHAHFIGKQLHTFPRNVVRCIFYDIIKIFILPDCDCKRIKDDRWRIGNESYDGISRRVFMAGREMIVEKTNPSYWTFTVGIEGNWRRPTFQWKATAWPGTGFAVDFVVN